MLSRLSTPRLLFLVVIFSLVLWGLVSFSPSLQTPPVKYLAATEAANTRTSAGTGVQAVPLSYCAHWFSRDGRSCIGSGSAGQLVVVDTGVPSGSSEDIAAAAQNCQRSGCKIALYCECANAAHVQRVKDIYAQYVTQFPNVLLPQVEVDGIRDIPGSNIEVARALGSHGLSLILKNYNAIERFSPYTPVARVIYEDIGRTGSYLSEFKTLAAAHPTLLISGILHQGSYASDLGGSSYPGTSISEAGQIFTELNQYKNVELFYGLPNGFQKYKAFDGVMNGTAREEGLITSRYTPPGATTPSPMTTGVANPFQDGSSLPNPQFVMPYSPANVQPFPFTQTTPALSTIQPQSVSSPSQNPVSTILNYAGYTLATTTPLSPAPTPAVPSITTGTVQNIDSPTQQSGPVAEITPTNQVVTPTTFTSNSLAENTDLAQQSLLESLLRSIVGFLQSTLSFFTKSRS